MAITDDHPIRATSRAALDALKSNRAHITDARIRAYLDSAAPTASQTVEAVKELLRQSQQAARQQNGIIRLVLGDFSGTD